MFQRLYKKITEGTAEEGTAVMGAMSDHSMGLDPKLITVITKTRADGAPPPPATTAAQTERHLADKESTVGTDPISFVKGGEVPEVGTLVGPELTATTAWRRQKRSMPGRTRLLARNLRLR